MVCAISVDRVCQKHEVMREDDANETSVELGSALGGTNSRGGVPVNNTMARFVDRVGHSSSYSIG